MKKLMKTLALGTVIASVSCMSPFAQDVDHSFRENGRPDFNQKLSIKQDEKDSPKGCERRDFCNENMSMGPFNGERQGPMQENRSRSRIEGCREGFGNKMEGRADREESVRKNMNGRGAESRNSGRNDEKMKERNSFNRGQGEKRQGPSVSNENSPKSFRPSGRQNMKENLQGSNDFDRGINGKRNFPEENANPEEFENIM